MTRREKAVLPLLLTELGLPSIKKLWENMAAEAEQKGWSCPQYLSYLCEQELTDRKKRRLTRRMSESQLPRGKNLESFDFSAINGVTKAQVLALASGDMWVKVGMNVMIFGPTGVGKTHLAAAIGEKLIETGFRVFFTRTTELVQKMQAAKQAASLPSMLKKLNKYDCLILDDIGYVQRDEHETSVLFELICERYENKSLIVTCNQPFKDWDRIFIDKQMAVAAVDRLVHHAKILEIDAESYRRKQAFKAMKERVEISSDPKQEAV